MSAKVMKALGIDVETLTKQLITGDGTLNRDEFFMFWDNLSKCKGRETAMFLRHLVLTLMDVLDGKKQCAYPTQALINTIQFVGLSFPLQADMRLQQTLKKWIESKIGARCPRADRVVQQLFRRVVTKEDMLEQMMHSAVTLHEPERFALFGESCDVPTLLPKALVNNPAATQAKCSETQQVVPLDGVADEGELVFVYRWVLDFANDSSDNLHAVLHIVVNQLRDLNAHHTENPAGAPRRLLALLFLAEQLLSYCRVTDLHLVDQLLDAASQFYLWPLPYALAARRLLQTCTDEMKAPSNRLLSRFAGESRVPEVLGFTDVDMPRARPLYYLINRASASAGDLASHMALTEMDLRNDAEFRTAAAEAGERDIAACLSPETTAMLLLSIIHHDEPLTDDDVHCCRWLTEDEDVYNLFYEALDYLQQALACESPETARTHRRQSMQLLREKIQKKADENEAAQREIEAAQDRGEEVAPLYFVNLPQDLTLGSDNISKNAVEASRRKLAPALPTLAHIMIPSTISFMHAARKEINELGRTPPPQTPTLAHVRGLLESVADLADAEEKCAMRFIIAGDDRLTHAMVMAWASLRHIHADLTEKFDMSFYVAPFETNSLAAWLARYDDWYHRHVYLPLRQAPSLLLPQCAPLAFGDNPDMETTDYGRFLSECMQNYAREANFHVDVTLWQVQGWTETQSVMAMVASGHNHPDQCIPFAQHVIIGQEADAEAYARTAGLPDRQAAVQSKGFQYAAVPLTVEFEQLGADGLPMCHGVKSLQRCDDEKFASIVLSSLPSGETLACRAADPTSGTLEAAFVSQRARRPAFRGGEQQTLRQVTISSSFGKFQVLVDGEVFGPFKKVVVSPLYVDPDVDDQSKEQMTLPIKTFYPVRL